MITLAIEASSPRGSVALLRGVECLARNEWRASSGPAGSGIFPAVRTVLAGAGYSPRDVDLFVAGRGPGNYSGMRLALTLARCLALARDAEVQAADSVAALADELLEETGADRMVLLGDARRGQVWAGRFERSDPLRFPRGGWKLYEPEAFLAAHGGDLAASPERERVDALFRGLPAPALPRWMGESRFPDAERLACLVLRRRAAGHAGDPPVPLYLHPAVRIP
jgi:tRNA threonylcarbamoyladenosine biosynthesis protein TsaB